jgi:hypothetical protein
VNLATIQEWARSSFGEDEGGHRAELVTLIARAQQLSPNR